MSEITSYYSSIVKLISLYSDSLIELVHQQGNNYIDLLHNFGVYLLNNGEYGLYIGEYSGDERNGNGKWLVFAANVAEDDTSCVMYQGKWKNKNGEMIALNSTSIISGNVVDGLWDGEVTISEIIPNLQNGSNEHIIWNGNCHNGKYEALKYDDLNSEYPIVFGITNNGEELHTTEKELNKAFPNSCTPA